MPTTQYALIGHPVSHSFSPDFFNEKFEREGIDARYEAIDLPDISRLPALMEAHPYLKGINVTLPYKESVLPFLDVLSDDALEIGAVNCIALRQGVLAGFNTDWQGFRDSLLPLLQSRHDNALVLGSGGASKAVQFALKKTGISYQVVSRQAKQQNGLSYESLTEELIQQHPLLINTTPLGMYPRIAAAPPIPYQSIGKDHLLYDLIYRPEETLFLKKGKAAGAEIKNGLEMLELQAQACWRIWNETQG